MAKPLILLVEDNHLMREVAERGLRDWDVEIHAVNGGNDAVEMALKNNYDLILMDIMMPDMDGFEATRRIREAGLQVVIIGVTAIGDQRECLAVGMNDFSTKPADFAAIIARWLPGTERLRIPEKIIKYEPPRESPEFTLADGRVIT